MTKKLRVGVIGANLQGSWGTWAHLPALAALDDFEASAVATSHLESAQATAAQFGIAHAFDDPRQLVTHPDVDIVAICVRVPAHRDLVLMALEAGKHVYCEWPLGRDTAEARELHEAAERAGVVHMVGLQSRSSPVIAHARGLIAAGAIGTIRSVGLTHSCDWISQLYPSMTYLQDRSSGAHFLSIPGGHSIDALTTLVGHFTSLSTIVTTARDTVEVIGTGETVPRTSADQIVVMGELETGVTATLRLSGASSLGTGIRIEINGDAGDLVIEAAPGGRGIQMTDLTLNRTVGMGVLEAVPIPENAYAVPDSLRACPPLNVGEAYLHMADAIAGKRKADPGFGDAVKLHELLDLIELSATEGRRVSV
jgi:predicted dehydrogenase